MAPRGQTGNPIGIAAIQHADKRTNIPTADAHDFVDLAAETAAPLRYARDRSLDPQLVWRGKDEQDAGDLFVEAPPIYIQEKIDPRVLIENLRRTAAVPEAEPELTLFDSFDGLDELDLVDFYRHEANWSNRMILGDSLQVMGSLTEREQLRGQVQMIYIDPPYGIKFGSNWQASTRTREVQDGNRDHAARDAEQIKAFRDTWELGIHSYLSYLRDRLVVARDLLNESGSCFVQIGDENVHLVRSLMDEVFGSENFIAEICYVTTTGRGSGALDRVLDRILWFGRSFATGATKTRRLYVDKDWSKTPLFEDADGRRYSLRDSSSQDETAAGRFEFEFDGVRFVPPRGRHWSTNRAGLERAALANRLVNVGGRQLRLKRYVDEVVGTPLGNLWVDTQRGAFSESKYYVVQTADQVIGRCVLLATDPGDLVLDPTCGSGTTAYVAEQWGRRWITIDTSRVALALARQRLMGARYPFYLLADSAAGRAKESSLSAAPQQTAPPTNDIRYGFVHERVRHVTLKSIASNPDIKAGMTAIEIDAAIRRHAEAEVLYDRPLVDNRIVRVTGPFTVESLSPHRSLTFRGADGPADSATEAAGAAAVGGPNFEQSIIDNLAKAGIQNGKRNERIDFAAIQPHAGNYVQAVGERVLGAVKHAAPSRIGIAIGPQYGTVSPRFIKLAAREAIGAEGIDLLCVLGFAFDPQATGVREVDGLTVIANDDGFAAVTGQRKLGRLPVLFVRMNADLLMGEELKKTGAGNLFTVFGEPDIEIRSTDDGQLVVELLGVDVYDPTTGAVRSNDTSGIALWMIDTNYNEESFFVRHCYFTGGNDPFKRLKTALRADIDQAAWSSLYASESRPFPRPATGKFAVKVINDYGDEVMKVFEAS